MVENSAQTETFLYLRSVNLCLIIQRLHHKVTKMTLRRFTPAIPGAGKSCNCNDRLIPALMLPMISC